MYLTMAAWAYVTIDKRRGEEGLETGHVTPYVHCIDVTKYGFGGAFRAKIFAGDARCSRWRQHLPTT